MKRLKKILKYFLIGTMALLFFGLTYQYVRTKIDDSNYLPPGAMVDVGGFKLHLNCTGESRNGEPTVILDAGSGSFSTDWALVQKASSQFARVCSYDRAGMGWSDESPNERSAKNMVTELHTLIERANIKGPLVMVGHSFGGLIAQLFTNTYPDQVYGLVLVDSAHEDFFKKLGLPEDPVLTIFMHPNLATFIASVGMFRLIGEGLLPPSMAVFPEELKKAWLAKGLSTKFSRSWSNEIVKTEENFKELGQSVNTFSNKPLTVISAGQSEYREGMPIDLKASLDQRFVIWSKLQNELTRKSVRGIHIIAKDSHHMIPHEQPVMIVDAIKNMLSTKNID